MNLQEQIYRINEMMGNKKKSNEINWIKPDFETEEDEFYGHFLNWLNDDVMDDELIDNIEDYYERAKIEPLSNKEWKNMENTDSWNIETEEDLFDVVHGMWGRSKERIIKHSVEPIKNGGDVETPIVAYVKGHPPYLVAGNTRLSVCRMLGITPKVTKLRLDSDNTSTDKNEMKESELTEKMLERIYSKRNENNVW